MIHHDPIHAPPPPARNDADPVGGGGLSATTLYLQDVTDINAGVTEEFGDLPLDRVRALVEQKRRAGSQDGGIVIALRALKQRLASEAHQHVQLPSDSVVDHSARVAALDARARAIAPPDADEFAIQWLMVYLEEGASDDEARRLLEEWHARARAVNEEEP
jgi:hypothetical protein